jgi:hypothetical protein
MRPPARRFPWRLKIDSVQSSQTANRLDLAECDETGYMRDLGLGSPAEL